MEIISKEEQPLLKRTVIKARIAFEGKTPSRQEVRRKLAKALKAKEELLIIKHIYTGFGERSAEIHAALYERLEDAKAVEHAKLLEKHVVKEEQQEEEAAGEKADQPSGESASDAQEAAGEKKEE